MGKTAEVFIPYLLFVIGSRLLHINSCAFLACPMHRPNTLQQPAKTLRLF